MIVLVDGKHLTIYIRYEQVHPSIFVEIGRIYSHTGARPPVGTIGNARLGSNFFETTLPYVLKEKIGHCVITNKQIQKTIIVDVSRHGSPGFPRICSNSRRFADICKGSVAIVVKKPARHGLVEARNAVPMLPFLARTTRFV